MRKTFLLLLLFFTSFVSAQKKLVVIEEFTNSGCQPCGQFAPTLDKVINNRLGDVIAIKYHGSYPNRRDPFFLDQKEDIMKREDFYGITGYPTVLLNGNIEESCRSEYLLNSLIDQYMEEPIQINLDFTKSMIDADNVKFNVNIKPVETVSSKNLRLVVVLYEDFIVLEEAFSNGEKELHHTMRRTLPNADGQVLPETLEKGKEYSYELSSDLSNFINKSELGAVAFIQDYTTKKMIATAYIPKDAAQDHILTICDVLDTPNNICSPIFYGRVAVRNDGGETIKSAKMHVEVNGTEKAYDYICDLKRFQRDTIEIKDFPEYIINEEYNKVIVWFDQINGPENTEISSEYTKNFSSSIRIERGMMLKVYTDNKPEEISWTVYNSAGDVIQKSKPYEESRTTYKDTIRIQNEDCYTLEFFDKGGNGIKGENGNGYYTIYQLKDDGKTKKIEMGDYDSKYHTVYFYMYNINSALGINNIISDETSFIEVFDNQGKLITSGSANDIKNTDLNRYRNEVLIFKVHDATGVNVHKMIIK